jgi:3-deoxy-D-manno-octulosonic-acid transferase
VDRVLEIREQAPEIDWLPGWKGSAKLLIIGSAWPEDLVYLQAFARHAVVEAHGLWKLLVVPHETDPRRIDHVVSALQLPCELYTEWRDSQRETDILVLNTVGMLSRTYRYADAAWIGGAFKTGLHNTLEAAVYGIPIGFGPRYHKFQEAADLIEIGQARSFPEGGSVWAWFQETTEEIVRKEKIREVSALYFDRQKGAGKSVARYLESLMESE